MPRNLLQDIVKVKHSGASGVRDAQVSKRETKREDKRSGYTLWFVAIISIIFFIFSISYLFLKVVVTVNPKTQDVVLNENLTASKGASAGALSFDLIVISGEENKMLETTLKKDVSEKAKGVVLIYNTFSSKTQRLDIDTRLEGSNGKIYKTVNTVVVPGMKGNTPGSIEVGIYAAEAGEEYNSGPLDFTIFGFKGTPKYSKFYGRSKGEITGGFKGKASIIPEADKSAIINDLKTSLQAKLLKKAADQIPSGFILFKDAVILSIDENNTDHASIKIKATLYGFLFNEDKLAKKIAES